MEIKVTVEVIKFLVARHISAQVNRYVKPSDVRFASEGYGDNVFDYAFTNIEDELENEVTEPYKPNCKFFCTVARKPSCDLRDGRIGSCVKYNDKKYLCIHQERP